MSMSGFGGVCSLLLPNNLLQLKKKNRAVGMHSLCFLDIWDLFQGKNSHCVIKILFLLNFCILKCLLNSILK